MFSTNFFFFFGQNKNFRCTKLVHRSAGKHRVGWGKDRLFLNLGTQWLKKPTQRTQPSCRAPGHPVCSSLGPAGTSSAPVPFGDAFWAPNTGQDPIPRSSCTPRLRCSAEPWSCIELFPHPTPPGGTEPGPIFFAIRR